MDYQGNVIWSVKLVMRVFDYVFFFNLCLLVILGHVYKFDLALFILWRECNTMEVIFFFICQVMIITQTYVLVKENGRNDKCET